MKEKQFKCPNEGCNAAFTEKTNLNRHLKTCSSERPSKLPEKVLMCSKSWCTITCSKQFNLDRHELKCRRPVKDKKKCFICKQTFSTTSNLTRHLNVHAKAAQKPSEGAALLRMQKKSQASRPQKRKTKNEDKENEMTFPSMVSTSMNALEAIDYVNPEVDGDYDTDRDIDYINYSQTNIDENNVDFARDVPDQEKETNIDREDDVNDAPEHFPVAEDDRVVVILDEDGMPDVQNSEEEKVKNEKIFSRATRRFLRKQIRQSRDRINKKVATSKMIIGLFEEDLKDESFFAFLADELLFASPDELRNYLHYAHMQAPCSGRKTKLSQDIANTVYFFWKENSIISVDRRNDRHNVKIAPKKLHRLHKNIEDDNVKTFQTENGKDKFKGNRYIYTKSIKALYEQFTLQTGYDISRSSFYLLKPFYIVPPSTREMESCTCISCVNPHYIYKAFKNNMKKITGKEYPESLTAFLTQSFKCQKNTNFDYWDIDCIKGTCKGNCEIQIPPVTIVEADKKFSYVVFKPTLTKYHNKYGKAVYYSRCARNVEEASLKELREMLLNGAEVYLAHRYAVSTDKEFWKKFKAQCPVPILNMDYSENMKFTPKNEVQSNHFSGRQHTLHCCVHHRSNRPDDHEFIYHLSDDTNHDAIMTFAVINDLLIQCPKIVESGTLVLRSDNCSTQYKSRFTFAQMALVAKSHDIDVWWFYGAPGHGRGLVDAMSSFGAKGPLRNAILTSEDEIFFNNVAEVEEYLQTYFANDDSKKYFVIDEQVTARKRRVKKENRAAMPIKGSSELHLVGVSSAGEWVTRQYLRTNDDNIMSLTIDSNDIDEFDFDDIEEDCVDELIDEDREDDPEVIVDRAELNNLKFDFLTIGSYVSLHSASSGFEPFYLVEVLDKGIANKQMVDEHQHAIPTGHEYMRGCYFEKEKEKRNDVFYNKSKKYSSVLINMNEIASVNVDFDGLKMPKEEYVLLCSDAL